MSEPQHFLLPAPLANAIATYLWKRPYGEVFQIMGALQQMERALASPEGPAAPDELVADANESTAIDMTKPSGGD